jgi:hypothetical protein
MADVAKERKGDEASVWPQRGDAHAKPEKDLRLAVCTDYLLLLGKPTDMEKVRAVQVTPRKYRLTLWRRNLGITDSAFVAVTETGTITGVQKDCARSKATGIVKRY